MLKPCKDCGSAAVYRPRRVTLCAACKARRQREYCRRTNYHKKRYARFAPRERERHLLRKYGITQVDYQAMFAQQQGGCAVCGRKQARPLDVDHCHVTGVVRGLLCTNCNRMIGHGGDSPVILETAAAYLRIAR